MARLRYNGLKATLGGSLTDSATSVTFSAALTHVGGANVPTISGSDYIPLTLLGSTGVAKEIVYLTAYTSGATTGTIARGKEDTFGVAHSSGATLVNAPTALEGRLCGCSLTKSSNQSVAASTEVGVTFDGENYDTDAFHNNSTNTSRVTVPYAGIYQVLGSVRVNSLAIDKRATAYILKNGSFYPDYGGYTRMTNSISGESLSMPVNALVVLAAGDYVELGVYQTDTVARDVPPTSSGTSLSVTLMELL